MPLEWYSTCILATRLDHSTLHPLLHKPACVSQLGRMHVRSHQQRGPLYPAQTHCTRRLGRMHGAVALRGRCCAHASALAGCGAMTACGCMSVCSTQGHRRCMRPQASAPWTVGCQWQGR